MKNQQYIECANCPTGEANTMIRCGECGKAAKVLFSSYETRHLSGSLCYGCFKETVKREPVVGGRKAR